jgi:hypothetical protein
MHDEPPHKHVHANDSIHPNHLQHLRNVGSGDGLALQLSLVLPAVACEVTRDVRKQDACEDKSRVRGASLRFAMKGSHVPKYGMTAVILLALALRSAVTVRSSSMMELLEVVELTTYTCLPRTLSCSWTAVSPSAKVPGSPKGQQQQQKNSGEIEWLVAWRSLLREASHVSERTDVHGARGDAQQVGNVGP